jgi:hypothetical protein
MLREDRAMMKAFMSTQRAHGSGYDSPRLQTGVEALLSDRAVNEASRILAHVQAGEHSERTVQASAWTLPHMPYFHGTRETPGDILRESLTAFCTMETL